MLVYFSGDWDVHWGYGGMTHGHFGRCPTWPWSVMVVRGATLRQEFSAAAFQVEVEELKRVANYNSRSRMAHAR